MEDTGAKVTVPLEPNLLLRSSVPDRILQLPMLTLRGFKDPDVLGPRLNEDG